MKALVAAFIPLFGICIGVAAAADDFAARAWQMESKGDAAEAREYLQRAAQTGGIDAELAYAQFLDRHRDPAAREAYEKVWGAARGEQRELAARRMVVLDLIAGDRDAAGGATSIFRRLRLPRRSCPRLRSRALCAPSPAWRLWLPKSAPRTCCPPWRATW